MILAALVIAGAFTRPIDTAKPDAQRAFDAASRTYGVPVRVLLGVSYMESRWDDHGHAPSTSGGYGPLHLTNISVEQAGDAKGVGSFNRSTGPDRERGRVELLGATSRR